jgi:hypothetical protein
VLFHDDGVIRSAASGDGDDDGYGRQPAQTIWKYHGCMLLHLVDRQECLRKMHPDIGALVPESDRCWLFRPNGET